MKDELEERMAEIKKTAQKVRQKLKGIFKIYYYVFNRLETHE